MHFILQQGSGGEGEVGAKYPRNLKQTPPGKLPAKAWPERSSVQAALLWHNTPAALRALVRKQTSAWQPASRAAHPAKWRFV